MRNAVGAEDGHFRLCGSRFDLGRRRRVGRSLEFVSDADRLDDQQIVFLPSRIATPPPLAQRFDFAMIAQVVLDVALDRLASGQTRRHQRFELDNVRIGEFESIEGSPEDAGGSIDGVDGTHNLLVGGASARIDQKDFAVVDSVGGDQFAHKDGIGRVLLLNFEEEAERVANLGRRDVATLTGSDFHDDGRRWNDRRLFGDRGHSAGHRQVQSASQSVILQLVRASQCQADILARHDLVVMLRNLFKK